MNNNLNLFLQPRTEVAVLPIENKKIINADKSELSIMASRILEGVDDGEADPLDTLIMAKKGVYVFEAIVEGLKGKIPSPEKNAEKYGCTISERTTGVKYYFDGCNDPIWTDLKLQASELDEKIKAREAWLKGFSKPTEIEDEVDEESGEVLAPARKISPPVKIGGQSIVISIL